MNIDARLLARLALVGAFCVAVLCASLCVALLVGASMLLDVVIVLACIALFVVLFWLWIYWLLHFRSSGKTREFWLCYCLPYAYSTYRTVRLLRSRRGSDVQLCVQADR